jgi:hypothetical protein
MRVLIDKFYGLFPALKNSARIALDVDLSRNSIRPWRTNKKVSDKNGKYGAALRCGVVVEDRCRSYAEGLPGLNGQSFRSGAERIEETLDNGKTWKPLGFPLLNMRPEISLVAPIEDDSGAQTSSVVCTFVDSFGRESMPSLPSNDVLVTYGAKLLLSGLPSCKDSQASSINIYLRRSGFRSGAERSTPMETGYFLAKSVPCGTTSTSIDVIEPGEALSTIDYEPPPTNARDLSGWRSGQLSALCGNSLRFSTPNHFHAWPIRYSMQFYGKAIRHIVGKAHGYVLTDDAPFVVRLLQQCHGNGCHQGDHADAGSCISARSAAIWNDAVVYAARDGLTVLNGFQARLVSFWDLDSWQQLRPDTMQGAVVGAVYYGLTSTKFFRLDLAAPQERALTELSDRPLSIFSSNERLFLVMADGVYAWNEGESFKLAHYVSPEISSPHVAMTAARVKGDLRELLLTTNDGREITFDRSSRIEHYRASPYRANRFTVTIRTTQEVAHVDLATGVGELDGTT